MKPNSFKTAKPVSQAMFLVGFQILCKSDQPIAGAANKYVQHVRAYPKY